MTARHEIRKDGTEWTSQGEGVGGPARGTGTRPPFAKGNTLAVRGGVDSPRVVTGVAQGLAADLLTRRPDLANYPEAVERWATAAALAVLLTQRLDEVGVFDPETGNPRTGLLRHMNAVHNRAERAGMLLGLDPSSEARLARDRAATAHLSVDIAAILARGQAATDERAAAGLPPPYPDHTALTSRVLAGIRADGQAAQDAAAREHAARGLAPMPTDPDNDTPPTDPTDPEPTDDDESETTP